MTDQAVSDMLVGLRSLLGEAAIERLSGLDRRTIQRAIAGQAEIYPDTLDRLSSGLTAARQLAAGDDALTADDAMAVIDRVVSLRPAAGPAIIRAALLIWRAGGSPLRQADIAEALTGDRNATNIASAILALEEIGLIQRQLPPNGRGVVCRWINPAAGRDTMIKADRTKV